MKPRHSTALRSTVLGCAIALLSALVVTGAVVASPAPASAASSDGGTGRMLLVLDSSGSMKEPASGGVSKIQAAKTALDQVVGTLPTDADVGLRVFGATVFSRNQPGACTDSQLVVPPATGNRAALTHAIGNYTPYGETPIGYALKQAAKDLGGEGQRSIVLVSDGIATCAPDPCVVARQLASHGIDLQIDVVGLGVSGQARNQLRCVAAEGNGTYYDANSADQIASSLSRASDRAVRPFQIDGKPIKGGPTSDRATPITAGAWTDMLGPSDSKTSERWFSYARTLKSSTVLVAADLLAHGSTDSVAVEITTEDGDLCDGSGSSSTGNDSLFFGVGALAGSGAGAPIPANSPCLTEPLLIKVSRALGGNDFSTPYTIRVVEEPHVSDAATLPPELDFNSAPYVEPPVTGKPKKVVGGSSFGDAISLSDGSYRGTIVPGETQVFKVHLEWGQRLSAKLLTPAETPTLRASGASSTYAGLQILNPMGVPDPDSSPNTVASGELAGPEPASLEKATVPVRWNNRSGESTAYLAGDYYLVYGADKDPEGDSAEFPYVLRVQVQGKEAGAPTYADGAALVTGAPGDSPSSQGQHTGTSAARDVGSSASPLMLGGAGALVLVALVCAGVAIRLLRRSPG